MEYKIDSVAGSDLTLDASKTAAATISALLSVDIKTADQISITGPVKFQKMETIKDLDSGTDIVQPKGEAVRCTIHHHHLGGGTARTTMRLGDKIYRGVTTFQDGKVSTTVETVEIIKADAKIIKEIGGAL
jgi:hypothetical protein